jgi:hypothetical protein
MPCSYGSPYPGRTRVSLVKAAHTMADLVADSGALRSASQSDEGLAPDVRFCTAAELRARIPCGR